MSMNQTKYAAPLPGPARELHPEGVAELDNATEVAWRAVDPDLLELCRRRVAEMIGAAPAAATSDELLTTRERAHLEFTEQFVISVSTVGPEQVDALLEHASAQEVYDFSCALYLIEMSMRAALVLESTLDSPVGNR
jgi:alkylhydroperoxidase family enzyme